MPGAEEIQCPQITRLAPSPTGALHLGNARTFLINWAIARQQGWKIVLRIEDLDSPRIKPESIQQTIDLLAWLGIDWDEGPIIQSLDQPRHVRAMEVLARAGRAYPCNLSRSEIESAASAPQEGSHEVRYPPELRPSVSPRSFDRPDTNWRFVVEPGEVAFHDRFLGPQRIDPSLSAGDFVLWTRRGQAAYQLAVVVDDHAQGITQVVRGDDLLESAARQVRLMEALRIEPRPTYTHLPLVVGEDGRRLAKRHGDTRLVRYRETGVPAERVIALLAKWSGVAAGAAMSADEFRVAFDLRTMPKDRVVFGQGDERWILAN